MDVSLERDSSSALGTLFQQIINDMKNASPLWEDFIAKATKLHACLRAAIQAIAAYLDAFQKIADAATNSRGASKEIGTALTRVCLRHKAVETRLKTFTTAIMDCLVQPLQEKLEEWKRSVVIIDKEHAKEYKRYRTELKKRSTDTLRLQKKARKGQSDTLQSLMDIHMQDVTLRRAELEEVEKKSLRSVMIEERTRYCNFVHMLQPVVKEECEVISELGHLQEAMQSIALVTKEPHILPAASEELIHDVKASVNVNPESPGGGNGGGGNYNIIGPPNAQPVCSNSLGSRKSSVCSISSMNSSGSSNSPGHSHHPRSMSKLLPPNIRLKPGESSDSGFCSSPALTAQNPETIIESSNSLNNAANQMLCDAAANVATNINISPVTHNKPPTPGTINRPPLPVRCSSLERSLVGNNRTNYPHLLQRQCPSPIPAHVTKELSTQQHLQQTYQQQQLHHQYQTQQQQQVQHMQQSSLDLFSPPTYANISELNQVAAIKYKTSNKTQNKQQQGALLRQQQSLDSMSSLHSNDSVGGSGGSQHAALSGLQQSPGGVSTQCTQSQSINASSNASSLHSHASIESNVTTSMQGQTPSSGSSTPQNHYSPLVTNSPSSTTAGTPSGGSMSSGCGILGASTAYAFSSGNNGTVYNVYTLTPPPLLSSDQCADGDALKISETDGQYMSKQAQLIDEDDSTQMSTKKDLSSDIVENDERSRASVLQKASMFEKQAAAVKHIPSSIPSAHATRTSIGSVTSSTLTTADSVSIYGTAMRSNHSQNLQQQHYLQTMVNQQDEGGVGLGSTTRITRRSSVNTAKPPPPIRRSSSVTPSPNTPNTSFRTSSLGGIYALPKALNNMSSFRAPNPRANVPQYQPQHYSHPPSHHNILATSPMSSHNTPTTHQPKTNPNLIAQLNARINRQQQQQKQEAYNENIYGATTDCNRHHQQRLQQSPDEMDIAHCGERNTPNEILQQQNPQQQQKYDDYNNSTTNMDRTGSIRNKAKAEFLENLNAKLAKQGLSGRAFAVRNLINSKALPDPRICHESLMDQIKRGATLKRNQKINDRSAPKIY